MKKTLLTTLATFALLATPALASEVLDSHGKPVATKNAGAVAIAVPSAPHSDAEATKAPAKKAATKHKKKAHTIKHKAKKAAAPASTQATPAAAPVAAQ